MKYTGPIRGICLPVAAAATLALAGCANPGTPPLYQWSGYEPAVYDYLKGEKAPQEQLDALNKAAQQIRAKGNATPPGFHAQLGMLYATVGNDGQAMQEFDTEKSLFPEASTYMDFLMKKPKQQ
ncbi:DUF4810 domain-containing protein [Paraburkholderia sp. D15]|uniref:DUF4810 domain-containing protein n=1 Tax=Paraburkholderia sp. D15 TaxID=2880218 RepID=UPI00247B0607|nr:DUF4810 domain-containing protein [Paraburkholderia sp. D15]WGS50002.1 DUF4810 domain-containing protein [Paraburkholderia sp. D15]WKF57918.1 hypothetical protein HUO10_002412 [Paraburkholderia busanensis]